MAKLAWIWLALISIFQVAYSKETDRSHWVVPDGRKDGNFLSTYNVGDSIRVEWVGWDSSYTDRLMANSKEAKLYVNAWNSNYSSFVQIISSPQDVSNNGHYNWTIEIDEKYIAETKQFGFTFIPTGYEYSIHGPRMYSPGINVYPKNSATTTGASSPTSTTTSSDKKATETTTSNSASSGTSGLSPGAKAGIGVGVSVAGLAVLAAVGFLILRKRRQSPLQEGPTTKFSELGVGAAGGSYQYPSHQPGSNASPVELASTLDGK